MANTTQQTQSAALSQAAAAIDLNIEAIQARVDAVLAEEIYWFPIRHHSPTAARHVEAAIKKRRPKVLFLEAPSAASDLLPHIVDSQTRPPIAIYSSYRDDDNVLGLAGIHSPAEDIPFRYAAWSPLLSYSPEYVAMKSAAKLNIDIVFIDLPHYALLKPASEAATDGEDDDQMPESNIDTLIATSDVYRALARVGGYRSWDEAWDCMFEFGGFGHDLERFRRELATFCAAARATTSPTRMMTDGTFEREAFMIETIEQTLKDKNLQPAEAMVVCGGFHLFMARTQTVEVPLSPAGTTFTSLMPYSFFRVSEMSGYAAGNRAPQFYQSWWEHSRRGKVDDLLINHVVSVLKRARRLGEPLSSADAISVTQHAGMLAHLRRHERPVLDDIHDALITCCCKGDPNHEGLHLRRAMDEIDIGRAIGQVTPHIGRLPLVTDFFNTMANLQLGELLREEKQMKVRLDKREAHDRRQSAFLHRLVFLKIPLAHLTGANTPTPIKTTLFKESWSLKWSPEIEPKLTEENLYGDTIEAAVLARLREQMAKNLQDASKSSHSLRQAVDMDLPDLIQQLQEQCQASIALDTRLVSLAQALLNLTLIDKQAEFRKLRRDIIQQLIGQCYDRACFAIPTAASVPESEQEQVIKALKIIAESVFRDTDNLFDRDLFAMHVMNAAEESTVPFLKGALYGLLAELKVMATSDVTDLLKAYAGAPAEIMVKAGDFLDGMLAVSRTSIILGADSLILAIEALLKAANDDAFLTMLPRVRAAFERLHDEHRASLARRVAELHGLREPERLTELNTSYEAAVIISRIDRQVNDIMKRWEM